MSEQGDLLASTAKTIEDYRIGDLAPRTPDDVDRWIQQFATAVQLPLLREMNHVLDKTYFTRANVSEFFSKLITQKALGVRPSNRRDSHITSCCAPRMSVATLGDGRIGVQRVPEVDDGSRLGIKHRGDTA
jgi:hypothetical protein